MSHVRNCGPVHFLIHQIRKKKRAEGRLASQHSEVLERIINLKTAVGCEKAVQAIDVHRNFTNCVITFVGDESIFTFTRGRADFRDPTAVFRLSKGLDPLSNRRRRTADVGGLCE